MMILPMKYKIEKNTVQETLIIPLYARKVCSELYPNLYRDETAVRLIDEIDYDFSESEKKSRSLMQRFGSLEVAMRQNDLAFEVRDYLKSHPNAAVVNLGCGLDNTGKACDNGSCKIYNLDFPDVIALRQQLLPAGERYLDCLLYTSLLKHFMMRGPLSESPKAPKLLDRVSSRAYYWGRLAAEQRLFAEPQVSFI